jgi:UDP-N-acetylmuramoylalanine-D-glutamate ligase
MSYIKALESRKIAVVGGGVTGRAVLDFLTTRGISADLFTINLLEQSVGLNLNMT